jgi:hypothetical protein
VLAWIVIILIVLWLLGYLGPNLFKGLPRSGNIVHGLLAIALILVVLNLLGII